MIAIILKIIACSGLFMLFYRLFLQCERMFKFNRIYLLLTLVFSFIIPFIEFEVKEVQSIPKVEEIFPVEISQQQWSSKQSVINKENMELPVQKEVQTVTAAKVQNEVSKEIYINWRVVIPAIYILVTLFLLLRLLLSVSRLCHIAKQNTKVKKKGFTLVILDQPIATFSFLNYLYVSKNELNNGRVQPEIFRHELAHIKQKHSWDVLLVELLKALFWFNPFLYIYKKSIQVNHEFLADAEVLQHNYDTLQYQQLLLEKISINSQTRLASSFNYMVTKKRLSMMTKRTSLFKTLSLKFLSVPLLVMVMVVFSNKVTAQVGNEGKGVSKELFRYYKKQIRQATVQAKNADGIKVEKLDLAKLDDVQLLGEIYNKMSDEQKKEVLPIYAPSPVVFNLDLDKDIVFDLGKIGVDVVLEVLSDLKGVEEKLNSPEIQEKIKMIEFNSEKLDQYFESQEWKEKLKDMEIKAEQIAEHFANKETVSILENANSIQTEAMPYFEKAQEIFKEAEPYLKKALAHHSKMEEYEKAGRDDLYKIEKEKRDAQMKLYTERIEKYSSEMSSYTEFMKKYGEEMQKYAEKMVGVSF